MSDPTPINRLPAPPVVARPAELPPAIAAALDYWKTCRAAQRPIVVALPGGIYQVNEPPLGDDDLNASDAAAELLRVYFDHATRLYPGRPQDTPDRDA